METRKEIESKVGYSDMSLVELHKLLNKLISSKNYELCSIVNREIQSRGFHG